MSRPGRRPTDGQATYQLEDDAEHTYANGDADGDAASRGEQQDQADDLER